MSELYKAFVFERGAGASEARIGVAIIHPDAAGRTRPFPSSRAFALMLVSDNVPLGRLVPRSERAAGAPPFVGPSAEAPIGVLLRRRFEAIGDYRYTPLDQRPRVEDVTEDTMKQSERLHVELGDELVEHVRILEMENHPQTDDELAAGLRSLNLRVKRGPDSRSRGLPAAFWKQCTSRLPHATYAIRLRSPELLQHLENGLSWSGAAYDP